MKTAIATVVTQDFVPGTLVTLFSFLKHNPWFNGDICLIGVDAPFGQIKQILDYDRVRVERVSEDLVTRCDQLAEVHDQYKRRIAQFYSLEVFRLTGYDRVLFVDSDLLIRGDLSELFSSGSKVLASGDGYYYKGFSHDRTTFEKVEMRVDDDPERMNAFNAGVMALDGSMITRKRYTEMVKMISVENFSRFSTNHSDQLIFNLQFENDVEFISGKYNYRIGVGPEMKKADGVGLHDAHVIHFTAKKKPWRLMEALKASKRNQDYLQTYLWWHEEWNELMLKLSRLNR